MCPPTRSLVFLGGNRTVACPAGRVDRLSVGRISLGSQVGQHMMSTATLPLAAQGSHISQANNDFLARSRLGLSDHTAIIVKYHAAPGPAIPIQNEISVSPSNDLKVLIQGLVHMS